MKRTLLFLVTVLWSIGVMAQEAGVITRQSKYSVPETMDRIEAAVKAANGFQIFARVDFQSLASAQGGKIPPSQLLIFGRGTVLQPLLPQYPLAAIDLPLKILAWEDESGKVMVSYNAGEYMAQRHGIKGKDDVLKRITDATATFVNGAVD
ncbi:DUF302 domain-containing protein [Noviherbaspirillum denitrificans]|uniref:DUF302 domain-containing protein n=1 Tax=Noviherbaspirillum denitrificans TaxID=1968433 RepID=A0A254TDL0_9BURK|nr:DUF302 domain-containing protein [Noviherbaspirillum denitrificans]OWW20635.1 hypothetical protein AYR66_15225 [Noviherbaspirillum denitrificans]